MKSTNGPQIAYERDGVNYLDQVMSVFGGYKRRSMDLTRPFAGMRLLDAGCGTGEDARALAALAGPDGKVQGLDASADMIAVARERSKDSDMPVEFIQGDIYHIPSDDAVYDRVRADRVFQHLENPEHAMQELRRVTKAGGRILVMDVDWSTLVVAATPVDVTQRILNHHFTRSVNGAAGRSLYGLCKRAGFSELEVTSETFTVTDAGLAFFLWGLDGTLRDIVTHGVAESDEIDAWLADIKNRDRAGTFFSAITGFGICADKAE